ncbi:MAG: hypothetical protein R2909_20140 [Gemmatimonadales bacterium]
MRRSGHIRARSAASLLAIGMALGVGVGGCGDVGAERRDGASSRVLVEGRAADVSGLAGARRAAWAFARSYAVGLRRPGAPVRAASTTLRRTLAAQRARVAGARGGISALVVAILLVPRGRSLLKATMILRPRGGQSFPIAFVLRRMGGRWLVTELVGN